MARFSGLKDGAGDVPSNAPLRLSEHAHYVRMEEQVIVADMRSGRYLGLDDAGARAWELIGRGSTRRAIVDCLSSEYEVSADLLEQDVARLLQELLARRLVEYERSK